MGAFLNYLLGGGACLLFFFIGPAGFDQKKGKHPCFPSSWFISTSPRSVEPSLSLLARFAPHHMNGFVLKPTLSSDWTNKARTLANEQDHPIYGYLKVDDL